MSQFVINHLLTLSILIIESKLQHSVTQLYSRFLFSDTCQHLLQSYALTNHGEVTLDKMLWSYYTLSMCTKGDLPDLRTDCYVKDSFPTEFFSTQFYIKEIYVVCIVLIVCLCQLDMYISVWKLMIKTLKKKI